MASKSFLDGVENRRSIYALSDKSPISDERVEEIVSFAIKHVPSTFNVQAARAVILFGDNHKRLWDLAEEVIKPVVPEQVWEGYLKKRVIGFRAAYGSVLFFEDEQRLIALQQKNAMIAHLIPDWSNHSSGMHQFVVWTALELEGLGCNLQHYNYSPEFHKAVLDTWNLPASWKLKCQLNFGLPTAGPDKVKTFNPIEDRVKVFK